MNLPRPPRHMQHCGPCNTETEHVLTSISRGKNSMCMVCAGVSPTVDNYTLTQCNHDNSTASEYDPVTDTILWTCNECEDEWCATPTEDDWAFEPLMVQYGGGCVGCQ